MAEQAAGIQALRLVVRRGWDVDAVLTSASAPEAGATVADVARRLGLRTLSPRAAAASDLADEFRERRVDLLLNVHSLVVIDADVVAAPRVGSFNLHPGPLPEYAGLNAPSWAIFNGEPQHGVTLHWMDAGIDTGPVAWSRRFPLRRSETGISLSMRCVREGMPLIERLLDHVESRRPIPRRPQASDERRFFEGRPPHGGRLSWLEPSRQIVDFVRASDYRPFLSPWGHPQTFLEARTVGVAQVAATRRASTAPPGTVAAGRDGAVLVAAGDRWVAVERVHAEGAYRDAADVLRPGDVLG